MKKMLVTALTAALLALGLPTAAPAASGYPRCSSVWVKGNYVTKRYLGCRADGTVYVGVFHKCENGKRLYTSPDDRKWVMAPGRVKKGGNEAYAADYYKCKGISV